ncbi:Lysine 6-dehydrogenase [Rhodobacteraceae bacterium THAF1]|uniref:saccharopine dehydrogenase C-terminal domain-containing protein n=1 Tax=Palleronia sp. THAF1 TaxID=2587842 RepID=UPI000F4142BF|nr:saccharopine dehydrogenase C-terminal domain-containing protein [Palleronia sp. THAF1]QFU09863.1 Lysine 6-dehydrogenase [Palleronia sp. THAF1]VDC17234.1 Lysine 6-dehydrogenase [Rhodobacteraceae bacterium THAF1]
MTIHWCGTGLSAVPGLKRLLDAGRDLVVWNRTVETARAVAGPDADVRAFDLDALAAALQAGDVVVSMLPAAMHVALATRAIDAGAHFVSSSYIAPEMRALDDAAHEAGVSVVNEIGLDPGIDHLFAHDLMADYRASDAFDPANQLHFLSYCGGIPKVPNPFRYKFSWSPLGVLTALRSPSRSLRNGDVFDAARPWEALSRYDAPLPQPETFEVYPNRDSLPFMAEYGFDPAWDVRDFVRGTLRLDGWASAWGEVFERVETADDATLRDMARAFWRDNAYDAGEPDRVVMVVDLRAARDGADVYHKTWVMDAWGDADGTAMARLVSNPVARAVEAVAAGDMPSGVQAAPSRPDQVAAFIDEVRSLAQHVERVDRLS